MSKYKKNSAFASGAIVKHYKQQFKKKNGADSQPYISDDKPKNLDRWFKEKWVDVNPLLGITNDNAYPLFRPTHKVNSKTPTIYQDIPLSNLKEQYKLKQKIKGEKNLPTFKKKKTIVHNGGKLSSTALKNLLAASYDPKDEVDGYYQDKSLSSKTSKVFYNPDLNQTVVAHRGTSGFTDWLNNVVYSLGGQTAYKLTPRYKEAEKVQREAEQKYGVKNLTTIGHSQGGLQSELLGAKGNEIITLNKATRPFSNTPNANQYDIKASSDIVSHLNPFQPRNYHDVIIPTSNNPLSAHSIEVLQKLEGDIGRSPQNIS
jgi:hypothetical protein